MSLTMFRIRNLLSEHKHKHPFLYIDFTVLNVCKQYEFVTCIFFVFLKDSMTGYEYKSEKSPSGKILSKV